MSTRTKIFAQVAFGLSIFVFVTLAVLVAPRSGGGQELALAALASLPAALAIRSMIRYGGREKLGGVAVSALGLVSFACAGHGGGTAAGLLFSGFFFPGLLWMCGARTPKSADVPASSRALGTAFLVASVALGVAYLLLFASPLAPRLGAALALAAVPVWALQYAFGVWGVAARLGDGVPMWRFFGRFLRGGLAVAAVLVTAIYAFGGTSEIAVIAAAAVGGFVALTVGFSALFLTWVLFFGEPGGGSGSAVRGAEVE